MARDVVVTSYGVPGPGPGRRRLAIYSFGIANLYRRRPTDQEGRTGLMGGAEVQLSLLAEQLRPRFDIEVITLATDEADFVLSPGIRLHCVGERPTKNRIARFGLRSLDFWRALGRADADVYLERGAGFATFIVALHCRLHRRPFLYGWASDADANGEFVKEFPGFRWLYLVGRSWATRQVCQSEHQRSLLPRRQRARAVVIPNSIDTRIGWRWGAGGSEVLWVGAIKPMAKRPDVLLDLAAAMPHRRFRMVGELRGPPEFQARLRARIAALPNLSWAGFVQRADLPAEYDRARVLVNTSDYEGFSNTFLEAMSSGVPIVSLNSDPNGLLERGGAGVHLRGDAARLPAVVDSFFQAGPWDKAREACLRLRQEYDPVKAAARFAAIIEEVGR